MNTGNQPHRRVRDLKDLAQEVQPARDLWPGIKSRLGEEVSRPDHKARRSWVPALALAASIALVAIGVWIGSQRSTPEGRPGSAAAGNVVLAAFNEPEYLRQREQLLQALPARLAQLPPDSRLVVSESVQSIQQALENIEAELGRDSGDALLQALLLSTRQEEIRVLTAIRDADGVDGRI